VSNFAAWQIAKGLGISAKEGWARFECIQPKYNLVKRQAEVEILPLAESEQLGVIPYSPLGGGLLTGKYGLAERPESRRLVEDKRYQCRYEDLWMYEQPKNLRTSPSRMATIRRLWPWPRLGLIRSLPRQSLVREIWNSSMDRSRPKKLR
jgi:aryl-alcohol dehydrogenase-like predicted oxidoreductase